MTSTAPSSLRSGGQAFAPQCPFGSVPAAFSTVVVKPSQSGSFRGTGQGGSACVGFGQAGQLSTASGTPSPSLSTASVGDGVGEAGLEVGDAVGPLAVTKLMTSAPLFVLPRGSSQSALMNRR